MAITTTYEFVIDTLDAEGFINDLAVASFGAGYIYGGSDIFGQTFAVPAVLSGVYTGPAGTNIALAELGVGKYVAVTQDADSIRYELFSAGGFSYTGSIDIGQTVSTNPDVVALNGGGFVIASGQIAGGFSAIYLDFFDSSGAGLTFATVAFDVLSTAQHGEVSIAKLSNGNIAVGWVKTVGGEKEIWTSVFTEAGGAVTGATLVDTTGLINDSLDLTASGTGYAMAYRDTDGGGDLGIIEVRTFSNSGAAINATVISDPNDYVDPAITQLSNGMLVVAWSTLTGGFSRQALLDPSNLAVLANQDYAPSLSEYIVSPELAALGDGRFVQVARNTSALAAEIAEVTTWRVMTGDAANDTINAQNDLRHVLLGEGGNDKLYGGALDDRLEGGIGNDTLDGKGGDDYMRGGAGNDSYFVNTFSDYIVEDVGGGTDKVTSTAFDTYLSPNVENLTLGSGAVRGYGNSGKNTLTGNSIGNYLFGGADKDKLDGKGGADNMEGGDGDDTYFVDNVGDEVVEAAGNTAGKKDTVNVSYAGANYTLGANVENGNLTGSGQQVLSGNDLANTLTSKGNSNLITHFLRGEGGKDVLKGGTGRDALIGGTGADTLTGGAGNDYFQFDVIETSANKDTIKDFSHADDEINFNSTAFSGLAAASGHRLNETPALNDMFWAGASAHDTSDRIIYDQATGNLYYDPDGTGNAAQILVAVLTGKPLVDASDIYVF